jgi:hypothetical protein
MKIVLRYWNRLWQTIIFDTERGLGSVRWFSCDLKRCMGWGFKAKGNWYAVWLSPQGLVFQAGTEIWPMTPEIQCRNTLRGTERIFMLLHNDKTVHEVRYSACDDDEPTFDNLDRETTDFLYWVASVWNDERLKVSLSSQWRQAVVPSHPS